MKNFIKGTTVYFYDRFRNYIVTGVIQNVCANNIYTVFSTDKMNTISSISEKEIFFSKDDAIDFVKNSFESEKIRLDKRLKSCLENSQ